MWKIQTSRLNENYKFTDNFVEDILTWANCNRGLMSISKINDSKITPNLRSLMNSSKELPLYMLELSQSKEIDLILDLFYFQVNCYLQILQGVKSEIKLSMKSNDLIKKIFKYFYKELLDNPVFWKIYCPDQAMITKKQFRDEIGQKGKVCPYCDIRKIVVPIMNNLDHFLPISKYPLLGIHWRNLIVSCSVCNGILVKNSRILLPIFHPYFDEVSQKVIFKFNNKNREIKITPSSRLKTEKLKAKNFIDLFYLEHSYGRLWDEVEEEHDYLSEDIINNYDKVKDECSSISLSDLIRDTITKRKNHHYRKARKLSYTKLKLDYCDHIQTYAERFLALEKIGETI